MTLVCRVTLNNSVHKTYQILFICYDHLGFTVHDKKSVLIPTKEITFVGFILNSADMTEITIGKERVYFKIVP